MSSLAPTATMTLPNLLIPGVAKSGTTSMFWYLAQHPDICPADVKQINHFASLRYGDRGVRPLDDYAAHFAHWSGQPYRLDASPTYVYGGERLLRAVRTSLPGTRVIILLRDPVSRLWSSYRYKHSRGRLPPTVDFADFLRQCRRMRASGADREPGAEVHRALSMGYYDEFVPPWLDAFGPMATVVFFEHMVADPRRVLSSLFDWLGIDPEPAADLDPGVRNPTVQPRSRLLQRLATGANAALYAHLAGTGRIKSILRRGYYAVNGTTMTESAHQEDLRLVRHLYARSVEALARDLSARGYRNLPAWLDAP